ncbi:hypothetical protein [Pseudomonas asiatica]|uniref:hypothetical protein n=1 Tax=Pseudomonas asiatica TaxID=2219225 RepID=UPI0018AB8CF1|nr:hypothetical protein [Pseudomonas asiatica]MBF8802153.1 hypothetical protein [Pseudomonas asiatica]
MRLHSFSSFSVSTTMAVALIAISAISSYVGVTDAWFRLSENQIIYLYSTSAQVIAAVYGLTITGYLFFRSELLREAQNDDTRAKSIEKVEKRYLWQLIVITILVAITILLTNVVIAKQSSSSLITLTILLNSAQSSFAIAFVAISLFVLDVVTPHNVEAASQQIQNEIDPSHGSDRAQGSLEEFIRTYNEIENLLKKASAIFQPLMLAMQTTSKLRRTPNARLAELLWRERKITHSLFVEIKELITLRNAIVHGADPVVSQELVERSKRVLQEFKEAIDKAEDENTTSRNFMP